MTQEDTELLFRDLCARLPYFVKVDIKGEVQRLDSWGDDDGNYFNFLTDGPESNYGEGFTLDDVKPYLRPMSSMTEDEAKEFAAFHCLNDRHPILISQLCNLPNITNMFNWLNAHHFDYRGMIGKGLAIEAPEDMYKTE